MSQTSVSLPMKMAGLRPGIPLFDSRPARNQAMVASLATIAAIAVVDWKINPNVSLGYLYVFPILVVGVFASRWRIFVVAATCAVLREVLSPFPWDGDSEARIFLGLVAFLGAGLFVSELSRNRRLAMEHSLDLRREIDLREAIQEELHVLVESSPAAILTLGPDGKILRANDAAHRLFAFEGRSLKGQPIAPYVAALVSALDRPGSQLRTHMECIGKRRNGDVFLAHVWFSTYQVQGAARLAAIVLDVSEELRDREVLGLGSLAAASRILFGAVSHEVRNLSAAAAVAHANLSRVSGLAGNEDFQALGALVASLENVASSNLRLGANVVVGSIDLRTVLDELRVVIEPAFREEEMVLEWKVSERLPRVLADQHSLLQIFLNLAQNSQKAMAGCEEKRLTVFVACEKDSVVVRFEDSGPGVSSADQLFQPFARTGEAAGMGLFVSRTIARSFAGDLRHEPREQGACFEVHLARATVSEAEDA